MNMPETMRSHLPVPIASMIVSKLVWTHAGLRPRSFAIASPVSMSDPTRTPEELNTSVGGAGAFVHIVSWPDETSSDDGTAASGGAAAGVELVGPELGG